MYIWKTRIKEFILREILLRTYSYWNYNHTKQLVHASLQDAVKAHMESYDTATTRDFIDIFLHELNRDGKHESFSGTSQRSLLKTL